MLISTKGTVGQPVLTSTNHSTVLQLPPGTCDIEPEMLEDRVDDNFYYGDWKIVQYNIE